MRTFINQLFLNRDKLSSKLDYGKCLIIAGSLKYPGASFVATDFALTALPGYVSLAVPKTIYDASLNNVSYNVVHELISNDDNFYYNDSILKYDSILFGNGVNVSDNNKLFLKSLIKNYNKNIIIDASGIRLLASDLSLLNNRPKEQKMLLTPHLLELKDLLKSSIDSKDPMSYLEETISFSKEHNIYILIKSYNSILVCPSGKYLINNYSNPNMAKAGSGDAVAGFITGLLAYGEKYLSYEDLIINADKLIHQAANELFFDSKELNYNLRNVIRCLLLNI